MAAGSATRMADLTGNKIEKSFLRLGGRPIIRIVVERILKNLKYDPRAITIVVQDKFAKDFRHEFRDLKGINIHELETVLDTATNYYYASAGEFSLADMVLLHYADTIVDIDYNHMLDAALRKHAGCMIAVTDNIHHDYSEVIIENGLVTNLVEKPLLSRPTWTGVAIFRHAFIMKYINYTILQDFARHIFPEIIKQDKLIPYKVNKPYYDTGNIRSYTMLKEACDAGRLKL